MANETDVGSIRAKMELDAQGFNTEMDKAKASMTEAATMTKQANQNFRQLSRALAETGMSAKQIREIQRELKNARPDLLEGQLNKVELQLKRIGASDEEIAKVKRQIAQARDEANRLSNETDKAAGKTSKLGQEMDRTGRSAATMGDGMKKTAVAAAALTAAMVAIISKALETGATFEQAMAKVGAISQASFVDFMNLRKQALELGATSVFTATQAADAQGFLAMAGFEVGEIMTALPGVLNLAAAGQMELGRTADIASNILTGFGLAADQTNRVVDVMAKTMVSSNTNIEQLGYAMKYVAPVAASVGVSIEEASAAVGKLSDAGIQGEMAGTQLRAILLRLVKPVGEAEKVMTQLGIKTADAAGNILPLTEILRQVQTAFGGLTQAAQTEAAALIAGQEATAGFLTLLNTGADSLDVFSNELANAGGTAERIAEQQMDTLKGSIVQMESALEGVGITVGDMFAPAIRKAADEVTKLLLGFNNLDPGAQRALVTFVAMVPAIMGAVTAVYALRAALMALQISFPILLGISALVGAVAAVTGYALSLGEASEEAKAFAASQEQLNRVLNDNPARMSADDYKQLQTNMKQLNEVVQKRNELETQYNELIAKAESGQGSIENTHKIFDLADAIKAVDRELRGMDYANVQEATDELNRMEKASKLALGAVVDMHHASMRETVAHADNARKLQELSRQYDDLNRQASLTEQQKAQLANVTKQLKQEYPDLLVQLDEENRWHIKNKDALDEYIVGEINRVDAASSAATAAIQIAKTEAEEKVRLARAAMDEIEHIESQGSGAAGNDYGIKLPPGMEQFMQSSLDRTTGRTKSQLTNEINQGQFDINRAAKELESYKVGNLDNFRTSGLTTGSGTVDTGKKSKKGGTKKAEKKEKTAEQLQQEEYQKSLQYIEKMKLLNQMSEKEEAAVLQRLADKYKKNESIWLDAEKRRQSLIRQMEADEKKRQDELAKQNEKAARERYDASSEWIDMEVRRMTERGASEREIAQFQLEAWTRVRNRYDKDSDYYKRADKAMYDARMSLRKDDERAAKEAADAAEKRAKEATRVITSEIDKQRKAEIDALDERKKKLQQFYDDQLKKLDQGERARSRKEIEDELELYRAATSEKGQKHFLELQEQLRKMDLEDQKQALQDERDEKLSALDQQRKDIDSWYSDLKEAIESFSGDFKTIYRLTEDERFTAFVETNAKIKREMEAFKREMETISKMSTPSSPAVDPYMQSLIYQMQANSRNWSGADVAGRQRLEAENQALGAQIGATYNAGTGQWTLNGQPLFSKFHSGRNGFSGQPFAMGSQLLPNEIASILQNTETVFTPRQLSDLVSAASGRSGGTTTINIDTFMDIEATVEDTIDARALGREAGSAALELIRKEANGGGG